MKKFVALCLGVVSLAFAHVGPALASGGHGDDDNHRPKAKESEHAGEIRGVIDLCGPQGPAGAFVYVPGKSILAKLGTSGELTQYFVPKGTYNLVVEQNGQVPGTIPNVDVRRKRITDLGLILICPDLDGDGFDQSVDCDDANAFVYPGASEVCGNGIDDNCDGQVDEGCITCTDADQDTFFAQADCGTLVDCNDASASVHPNAAEVCGNGIDDNCNGQVDENCLMCVPGDPCGAGNIGVCVSGYDAGCNCVEVIGPTPEICDGKDNDCDGTTDEGGVCAGTG